MLLELALHEYDAWSKILIFFCITLNYLPFHGCNIFDDQDVIDQH